MNLIFRLNLIKPLISVLFSWLILGSLFGADTRFEGDFLEGINLGLSPKKPETFACHGELDLQEALGKPSFLKSHKPVVLIKTGKDLSTDWIKSDSGGLNEAMDIFWKMAVDEATEPSSQQRQLLDDFLKHPAGQVWLKAFLEELMDFTEKGYFKLELPRVQGSFSLLEVISPDLSYDGEVEIAPRLFKVKFMETKGAYAQGSTLHLGKIGKKFPFGGQQVDPIAIISHEFGHTRFGNMTNADSETILGEACTVKLYENPVRAMNQFESRKTYYSRKRNCFVEVDSLIALPMDPKKPFNCFDPL